MPGFDRQYRVLAGCARAAGRRGAWLALLPLAVVAGACRDAPTASGVGPPAQLVLIAGGQQRALAGTDLPGAIRVAVRDAGGRPLSAVRVTFTVTQGGGTLAGAATTTTDDAGIATAPSWRLGRSALPQSLRASAGALTTDIGASVASDFHVVLRFFGPDPVSPANQQLFLNAVARVRGLLTGDLIGVNALNTGIDLAECGITGQPTLNEIIDDVLIYASVSSIDGPGRTLARAGPCLVRSGDRPMTAVGVMSFDAADVGTYLQGTQFEDVIIHEIIHVLGFGTLWEDRGFVVAKETSDPRYSGPLGHHGCVAAGWLACATDIPVEAGGGPGTALSHWRESTFGNELLTGYYSASGNLLSVMTTGSLADLGFTVNDAAADVALGLPGSALRAPTEAQGSWERLLTPVASISTQGRRGPIRRPGSR